MDGLTEGRIVHYVLANGEHRPAIVVRDWKQENGMANLVVFLDGTNDARAASNPHADGFLVWATSSQYEAGGKTHHTWHWPERA